MACACLHVETLVIKGAAARANIEHPDCTCHGMAVFYIFVEGNTDVFDMFTLQGLPYHIRSVLVGACCLLTLASTPQARSLTHSLTLCAMRSAHRSIQLDSRRTDERTSDRSSGWLWPRRRRRSEDGLATTAQGLSLFPADDALRSPSSESVSPSCLS